MVPEGPAAMALPAPPPARVFAELVPAPAEAPAPAGRSGPPALSGREVHVSGSAELSAGPDRARVSLRLGSRKGAAGAARSSVARRLEYIAQSARQRGVPEENMTVTEDFSRVENTYQMEAEVCIVFSDFGKMQNVCNLLIEKLGTSVTISPPHFYHTPEAIDTLRRRVCVAAVGNTRQKAQEVCRLFGQSLGKPLLIREEETKEWGGHIDSHLVSSPDSMTLQERIQNATAYASCKVFAVFEIKGKENRRNKFL
ncbi:interleukin-1 receptor-associated kinase 1-binding protein 1 isoform X1 [Falco biarmicus]|uniref:interleukin-1 receptor-associated kinase 1-binding protein 1 isoform X1 n=1 Tax=Falco rusticolus TaxID=120794 RepID=UPI0018867D5A|nr:interleukin-1 receptor-associated kinase 1-binding protein 1 isoform X1 [Falco rusticolus]XP_055666770.1 interleukin-1 receptor-associated kinase 1-binding protein 1 isoform X1 [Falco peregrinus]XP_056199953.1 interleukin-1 receptor-associated kinase 1-binding protein 1 isoform X1 [Falco biarmicus]